MSHADALSRNPIVALIHPSDFQMQLTVTQCRDPIIQQLQSTLCTSEVKNYKLQDGIVYRVKDNRALFYVPQEMEQQLIAQMHERLGHFGFDKCFEQIRLHYYFPLMRSKIEIYIKNCVKCIVYSAPNRPSVHSLYSIPKKPIPFDTLHIDHFGPLPSVSSKQKHLLVVTDAFTKFTRTFPATSTSTAEVIRTLAKYFEWYSRPSRIVHDGGSCFTSVEFKAFLADNNIEDERVNRVLKAMLGKLTEPLQHADWTKQLKHVEFAINNSINQSTNSVPSKLLFGVEQKGPNVDFLTEFLESANDPVPDLESLRSAAANYIARSQEYSQKWFEQNCKPAKLYEHGDFVVIRNVDTSAGSNKKFIPKFRGPYVIDKVLRKHRYVVRDIDNYQLTQIPYSGVVEAKNMKLWKKGPSV